ncbi:Leucine Rich Repeat [Seminavis robusta]|uniref:Leucine Rich Repeat n=1 Tax=Seminavis robusta TaxID=568900 RepID=A0A9N8EJW2_9STRA|nr:Leucine Rich Repeat [Seminavis robusta]|eukprot:Sro1368_g266810.1 Leucine Rich Repeat (932) ;mRNA; f:14872-18114
MESSKKSCVMTDPVEVEQDAPALTIQSGSGVDPSDAMSFNGAGGGEVRDEEAGLVETDGLPEPDLEPEPTGAAFEMPIEVNDGSVEKSDAPTEKGDQESDHQVGRADGAPPEADEEGTDQQDLEEKNEVSTPVVGIVSLEPDVKEEFGVVTTVTDEDSSVETEPEPEVVDQGPEAVIQIVTEEQEAVPEYPQSEPRLVAPQAETEPVTAVSQPEQTTEAAPCTIPVDGSGDEPAKGAIQNNPVEASSFADGKDPEIGIKVEQAPPVASSSGHEIAPDPTLVEDAVTDAASLESKWKMTKERKTKFLLGVIGLIAFTIIMAAILSPRTDNSTDELQLSNAAPTSLTPVHPTHETAASPGAPAPTQATLVVPTQMNTDPTESPTRPLREPDREEPTTSAPTFLPTHSHQMGEPQAQDHYTTEPTQAHTTTKPPPSNTNAAPTASPTKSSASAGASVPGRPTSSPTPPDEEDEPTPQKDGPRGDEPTPEDDEPTGPRPVDEEYVLSLLPDTTLMSLEDPFSPQSKAFKWLFNDTAYLPHYSDDRILQRFALATFYHATNGPFWANNENWLNHDVHECQWLFHGPFDGYVGDSGIGAEHYNPCELDSFGSGPLRPNGGVFQHLSLWQNELDGMIPPEISLLSRLRSIDLNGNQMKGAIPPHTSQLTNLEVLALGGNGFFGTLPNMRGMTNLETLMLSYNYLSGTIPETLSRLTKLRYLLFDGNAYISGTIPPQLSRLSNVEYLYLSGTSLEGTIPSELGLLTNVKQLDLWNNFLRGQIPTEMGQLTLMEWPSWDGNAFTGTLPSELGQWTNLQNFDLYDTEIGGTIPSEFGRFTNMQWYFVLANNNLSGTVPSELGLLPVDHLYLHGNQLTGIIPSEVCYLNDTVFDCSENLCGCECGCFNTASGQTTLEPPSNENIYHPYFGVLLNVRNDTVEP